MNPATIRKMRRTCLTVRKSIRVSRETLWRRGWDSNPRNLSSPVVHCRLETCINKGDLRFEDLGSSEAAILKSQIRGGN